jgi:hypothetical protein
MKRAAVKTGYKTFHHLVSNQPEIIELVKLFYVENVFQEE